jgi:hypothetical protein
MNNFFVIYQDMNRTFTQRAYDEISVPPCLTDGGNKRPIDHKGVEQFINFLEDMYNKNNDKKIDMMIKMYIRKYANHPMMKISKKPSFEP